MLNDLKVRLAGLALMAVGAGVGWLLLLRPLQQARLGTAEVSYNLKAFVFVPAAVIFGAALLLVGSSLRYRTDTHSNFTATGWFLMILIAVSTAAGYYWFQQEFSALGYR